MHDISSENLINPRIPTDRKRSLRVKPKPRKRPLVIRHRHPRRLVLIQARWTCQRLNFNDFPRRKSLGDIRKDSAPIVARKGTLLWLALRKRRRAFPPRNNQSPPHPLPQFRFHLENPNPVKPCTPFPTKRQKTSKLVRQRPSVEFQDASWSRIFRACNASLELLQK